MGRHLPLSLVSSMFGVVLEVLMLAFALIQVVYGYSAGVAATLPVFIALYATNIGFLFFAFLLSIYEWSTADASGSLSASIQTDWPLCAHKITARRQMIQYSLTCLFAGVQLILFLLYLFHNTGALPDSFEMSIVWRVIQGVSASISLLCLMQLTWLYTDLWGGCVDCHRFRNPEDMKGPTTPYPIPAPTVNPYMALPPAYYPPYNPYAPPMYPEYPEYPQYAEYPEEYEEYPPYEAEYPPEPTAAAPNTNPLPADPEAPYAVKQLHPQVTLVDETKKKV